jgi:hypothetical protein
MTFWTVCNHAAAAAAAAAAARDFRISINVHVLPLARMTFF